MFSYQLQEQDGQITVHFQGDIDIDAGETIEEQLEPALQEYAHIILNMDQVHFVDSSGIGLLIGLVQGLQEQERIVSLEHIQPEVMEVFELLQLDEILGKDVFR